MSTDTMINFSKRTLHVDGHAVDLEYRIADAFEVAGLVIVRLDPDANLPTFGQFPNLQALTPSGERLWIAELPTTYTGDTYTGIASRSPLVAYSWSSYKCEIDSGSGRIVCRVFLK